MRILDRSGQPVLEARTGGPFLLAELPDGTYTVEVRLNGITQRKRIGIDDARPARGVFLFAAAR